jgi:phosphocarrier protein HPr
MTQEQVMITNKLGLHARAAAKLVHTASEFESEIFVGTDHEEVNAKSILGILTLAATKGTPLNVRADGSDEGEAVRAIVQLFADKFGEDQ